MAVVMIMHWAEATPAQYDQVRDAVGWETDHPDGAHAHQAWFEADGLHVVDVWESEAAFEAFVEGRLRPGVGAAGIPGQPRVRFAPLHRLFVPAAGVRG